MNPNRPIRIYVRGHDVAEGFQLIVVEVAFNRGRPDAQIMGCNVLFDPLEPVPVCGIEAVRRLRLQRAGQKLRDAWRDRVLPPGWRERRKARQQAEIDARNTERRRQAASGFRGTYVNGVRR